MLRKSKKQKSGVALAAMLFAVCVSITGCGGEYAGVNQAVSEQAVSGSAVREESDAKENIKTEKKEIKYRYATDTNFYYTDYGNGIRYIIQKRRDGTHEKEIVIETDGTLWLEYVDEGMLYYQIETEDMDAAILYCIPIEKDAQGYDIVKKSEQKELLKEKSIECTCWDSHYVLYQTDDEEGERKIVKYDLQKGKECSRQKIAGMEEYGVEGLFRLSDCYVAFSGLEDAYVQEIDGEKWKKCEGHSGDCLSFGAVQTENYLFYMVRGELSLEYRYISKCDGKKTESFVTKKQIRQAVMDAKGIEAADKLDDFGMRDIYASGDRLYIQVGLNWEDGSVFRMEYLIFSIGEEERQIRYEKELTECMQSQVKSRTGVWRDEKTIFKDAVIVNDAQCAYIMNGTAYLSLYDYENDKGRMGCYELQTGQFRWVSDKEVSCGELRYAGLYDNEVGGDIDEICSVFEKGMENNYYIGTWGYPSEDKEVVGDFHETK